MKSQGQQAAGAAGAAGTTGATDPGANQPQGRAAAAVRRLEPHNQPGTKEQALPSSRLRGQSSRLKEQAPWSPDFPFCTKPDCAGCRSTCRQLGTHACRKGNRDLEPLCERRKPCMFEYQNQYPVLLEVRDKIISNIAAGRVLPPQQKSSQRAASTPEEQQVASARKEVDTEEGDLQDLQSSLEELEALQSSREAQVTEQQMRTQTEEDTHTVPQETHDNSQQQEDLEQEDLPIQRDHFGYNWPGREDVEEEEEEEKLYAPRMKQRVTFDKEDIERSLQEDQAMSAEAMADLRAATAAAAFGTMGDLVQNPLHKAPETNANKVFGHRAISPLTFEGLARQPPVSTWRGYLPGLPETTTMPQVQNEIWYDLRRPAHQDSVFHTPVGETMDKSQAYSTIGRASARSRMMNEDMSPTQMQAREVIRRGSSIPPHLFDTVLEAAQGRGSGQERRAQYNFHDVMREAERTLQQRQREGEATG